MKPLKYVLVWYRSFMMLYDVIMWHRPYDICRVYDASSEWRRMIQDVRMNPSICSMHVCCHMYSNDIYMNFLSVWCTRRMRCMIANELRMKPYDVNMNEWRFREQMMHFSGTNDTLPTSLAHWEETLICMYLAHTLTHVGSLGCLASAIRPPGGARNGRKPASVSTGLQIRDPLT